MKFFKKSIAVVVTLGLLLFACTQDKVAPTDGNQNGGPSIAGALDAHPDLELVCSANDTITIWSEDGSAWCNKCYDMFGGQRPCDGQDSVTSWGQVVLMNGLDSIDTNNDSMYDAAENYFVANISMSAGWFIMASKSQFSTGNNWVIQNGIIQIQNDWLSTHLSPFENAWQLRKRVSELPNCFDVALNLQVISLDLFSMEIGSSITSCWGRNPNWNKPAHRTYSAASPFLTHFCPSNCGNTPPPPPSPVCPADTVCEVVYAGLVCNNGATTLVPDIAGATGPFTYNWSNGLHTASITVTPTVTTAYSVTVTNAAGCVGSVRFNVNVIDATCSIATNGGGNNGGGGCGNNGSGSGSGSHHHPGCNNNHSSSSNCNGGNHQYGCNSSHSGGTSNCNRKGHGYHCTRTHASNRACNGGHTFGCRGTHASNVTCQSAGAHTYRCSGQHTSGNCNTSLSHTSSCNRGNHSTNTGCHNGHSHSGHGNGSGHGSGVQGGHGTPTTPGVRICHTPPGNPGGATTVCVAYSQLNTHVTGYCSSGNSGDGGHNSQCNRQHSPSHSCNNNGHTSNCNRQHTTHSACNSGHHSGCNHNHSSNNGCNNGGHQNGCNHQHSSNNGCNHNGGNNYGAANGAGGGHCGGHGGNRGGGCQGNGGGGHPGDRIGACNSNPCN